MCGSTPAPDAVTKSAGTGSMSATRLGRPVRLGGEPRLDVRADRLALPRSVLLVPAQQPELLRAAVERVRPRLGGRRVQFDFAAADLPPVAADPDRLGHALDNLLVNAATYSGPAGDLGYSRNSRFSHCVT